MVPNSVKARHVRSCPRPEHASLEVRWHGARGIGSDTPRKGAGSPQAPEASHEWTLQGTVQLSRRILLGRQDFCVPFAWLPSAAAPSGRRLRPLRRLLTGAVRRRATAGSLGCGQSPRCGNPRIRPRHEGTEQAKRRNRDSAAQFREETPTEPHAPALFLQKLQSAIRLGRPLLPFSGCGQRIGRNVLLDALQSAAPESDEWGRQPAVQIDPDRSALRPCELFSAQLVGTMASPVLE